MEQIFSFQTTFHLNLHGQYGLGALLADIVFIGTMTACLLIPLEMHSRSNSSIRTPIYGIISGIMVYIGYMASWFFVCLFSNEWTMDDYGWVFYGYWGAIALYAYINGHNER